MRETILVTGAAGFIGFHLCKRLLEDGYKVIAIDNLNSYYDVNLKKARLTELEKTNKNLFFHKVDIENKKEIEKIFNNYLPEKVFNLAAQAGVRHSVENPEIFISTNINGFGNILEVSKNNNVQHLIYASSSSVYGGNIDLPYSEKSNVDKPLSIYAASKKANELLAHTYSHLYSLPSTGLRFFTVYGPWGRPDMAYFLFTKSILEEKPINIFNYGNMTRDFTYIHDIVESLLKIMDKPPTTFKASKENNISRNPNEVPHKIFNIGNSTQVKLLEFIEIIEDALGKKAIKNFLPMQLGDVPSSLADTKLLEEWISFKPSISIKFGINEFTKWYKSFYL